MRLTIKKRRILAIENLANKIKKGKERTVMYLKMESSK